MPSCDILSIDTAYDSNLKHFAEARGNLYREYRGDHKIIQLGVNSANRDRMLSTLSSANGSSCRSLVISSHGEPGKVLDDDSPDGILFAFDDDPTILGTIARGRWVYLCCCESALPTDQGGSLPEALLSAGAAGFVGFTGSPEWTYNLVAGEWRELDRGFISCAVAGQGIAGYRRAKLQTMDRLSSLIKVMPDQYTEDLKRMREVVRSMVIIAA